MLDQIVTVLCFASLIVWSAPARAQGGEKFKVRLTPVPLDATLMATVTGSGALTATLSGTKLAITGTFQGLRSPATIANVHRGVKTGVRGDAVFELTVSHATSGTVAGALTLTPIQVDDLKHGRLYVQIHSEKVPDGNLWGWLLPEK